MADKMHSWTVTTQQEASRPDATGRYVEGVVIGFTTTNGLIGTVFIPHNQYNPDNVKDVIMKKVEAMQAIQGLKG